MDALLIKNGVVENVIVVEGDESDVQSLKNALQADYILDRMDYNPIPQIGWLYSANFDSFTPPPAEE